MIQECCECGNFINHKARYVFDDFEQQSPYCQTCWDKWVDEDFGN